VSLKLFVLSSFAALALAQSGIRPVKLRCEALENPLGIDSPQPHLSWQVEGDSMQSAYEVLVSSKPNGPADVWTSGKTNSAAEAVDYAGPALQAGRRYFWTVRIWSNGGTPSSSSAWWEMGLLSPSDWKAQWIAWHDQEAIADRGAGVRWIWYPGDTLVSKEKLTRYFRYRLNNTSGSRKGVLQIAAHDAFRFGEFKKDHFWGGFHRFDVELKPGENTFTIEATSDGESAGLAALLRVGNTRTSSDEHWETAASPEGPWQPAKVLSDGAADNTLWPARPAARLRKTIAVTKPIRSARLYATALGSYRISINSARVGNDILTPDWTDYRKRVLYQTYDVTPQLKRGTNTVEALLGYGWYGSALGWRGERFNFGPPPPRLLAQIEVMYTDGTRDVFATDGTWKAAESPILYSELYAGEFYDARKEHAASWANADVVAAPDAALVAQMSQPIHVTQNLKPEKTMTPKAGVYVFDMAQNMVGWVKLNVKGPAGTRVRLRFAERLDPDGSIYTENLRGAEATDTYILRGGAEETFEPHFTYHGFRYVELTGYPGVPSNGSITGVVFHTDAPITGSFTSASGMVNRIWKNTMWGQRGNLESVPTDCPQRDERLGWMGDAGIFWRTATYNMDMQAFTHKWMNDVADAQSPEGGFPDVTPRVVDPSDGAPAWGDAGVILPWTTWLQYGDRRVIEENWTEMERWMSYIHDVNPDLIWNNRRNNDFGDWVPADSTTPKDLIATAYWAQDAKMMADMARATHRDGDAAKYRQLFEGIREAFVRKFVRADGTIGNGSQTCYALALHIGLVPEPLRKAAVDHLAADIQSRDWHLSTGFLGTPHLMFALSENGRADVAYTLLLNETYPSWGYTISKGATTIWERWNGDSGDPSMNSYNHYAFGSVVEWLYREVAGIDADPAAPGFEKIVIHPHPDARLGHARAEYDSIRGKIVSEWTLDTAGKLSVNVVIPANTMAKVFLPDGVTKEVGPGAHKIQ
jgi:alpha-L-rhamnosidase